MILFGLIALPVFAQTEQSGRESVRQHTTSVQSSSVQTAGQVAGTEERKAHVQSQADIWGITEEEWLRYEALMEGDARFDFKHLDPVFVLGIYARSEDERNRLAEIYVKQELRRVEGVQKFALAYENAAKRLNGPMPFIDMDLFRSRGAKPALSPTTQQASPASSINSLEELKQIGSRSNHRLILFVSTTCPACRDYYRDLMAQNLGFHALDIYFVGKETSDSTIRQWAKQMQIPLNAVQSGRITLNHDRGEAKVYQITEVPSLFVREVN
jgi:integrating conjugative element protein (TIGR03759 family)